jgi:hypothetical protein
VTAMVSDNLPRDDEPFYYLIEEKESCSLSIIFKHWHSFDPLCEVVYSYDDIVVPPCRRRVASSVINPPLGEDTNCDDRKHEKGMCPHLPREDLAWMALLDRFDTIFDNCRP